MTADQIETELDRLDAAHAAMRLTNDLWLLERAHLLSALRAARTAEAEADTTDGNGP